MFWIQTRIQTRSDQSSDYSQAEACLRFTSLMASSSLLKSSFSKKQTPLWFSFCRKLVFSTSTDWLIVEEYSHEDGGDDFSFSLTELSNVRLFLVAKACFYCFDSWIASLTSTSIQFSRSVVSDSLRPHELQHARLPSPSPTPRVYSNSRPSSQWCHQAISSSIVPFYSCPKLLPSIRVFSNESTLCMR